MTTLKGSERQKMLIDYIKNCVVPDGFYVLETKSGMIQFRRKKNKDPEYLIEKYENKIKKLREDKKNADKEL